MSHSSSSTDAGREAEAVDEHPACPTCGTFLGPLLPTVNNGVRDCDEDAATSSKQTTSEPKSKSNRKPRAPNVKQGVARLMSARQLVRRNMLTCIPGIGLEKAKVVIAAFPSGTLADIMRAQKHELTRLGTGRSRLTGEDADAIKRVIQ